MTRRRLWVSAVAGLFLAWEAGAIADAPSPPGHRVALVLGNGAYSAPQPALPNALNDARDMATALRNDGFQVIENENTTQTGLREALAHFVSALRPNDVALFYYAGHGAQGSTRSGSGVSDDFLIPVDAHISTPDALANQGVGLSEVLRAVGGAQAGAQLIILDACRDDPAAGQSQGLAWPVSPAARNAFIVFAASPGETAGDPPSGRHGVFTGELLKAMARPGVPAAQLFTEVANSVEDVSHPTQRPYFAGTGRGAALVLDNGARAEDATDSDLMLYRAAMNCGQVDCVDQAAPRVAEPRFQHAIAERRATLQRLSVPASTPDQPTAEPAPPKSRSVAQKTAPPKPPIIGIAAKPLSKPAHTPVAAAMPPELAAMPPDVRAYIQANYQSVPGRLEVGRRFLTGAGGFPLNERQAQIWLSSAASLGSGEAAFVLATALQRSNAADAHRWFVRAGDLGYPAGWVGAADTAANDQDKQALLQKGAAAGSVEAMTKLGEALAWAEYLDPHSSARRGDAPSMRYLRQAADRGSATALAKIGDCYRDAQCGVARNPALAVQWFNRAAAKGSIDAYNDLGVAYLKGEGVGKSPQIAMVWLKKVGFENRFAPVAVGRMYEKGVGVLMDEQAAARWYRRAAELGNAQAALKLAEFYDRRSWFNPAATAETRYWRAQAAKLGVPRFSPLGLTLNAYFAGLGLS